MLYRMNLDLMKSLHEGKEGVHDALHQYVQYIQNTILVGLNKVV